MGQISLFGVVHVQARSVPAQLLQRSGTAFVVNAQPVVQCRLGPFGHDPEVLAIRIGEAGTVDPEQRPQLYNLPGVGECRTEPGNGFSLPRHVTVVPGFVTDTRHAANIGNEVPVRLVPAGRRKVVFWLGDDQGHQRIHQGRFTAACRADDRRTAGIDVDMMTSAERTPVVEVQRPQYKGVGLQSVQVACHVVHESSSSPPASSFATCRKCSSNPCSESGLARCVMIGRMFTSFLSSISETIP